MHCGPTEDGACPLCCDETNDYDCCDPSTDCSLTTDGSCPVCCDAMSDDDCCTIAVDCIDDDGLCPGCCEWSNDNDCRYSHTIVIDGTNDFNWSDEAFDTTSGGYDGFVAWDDTYLYWGMIGARVGESSDDRFILVYLAIEDAMHTTTTGRSYGLQQPNLPMGAAYLIQWRTDFDETRAFVYDGAGWWDLSWDFSGDVDRNGSFVEMRIPLDDIGVGIFSSMVGFHMSMITDDWILGDWTRAGVPENSFTDSVDPNYSRYFEFATRGSTAPSDHSPL